MTAPIHAWDLPAGTEARPLGTGLINETFGAWRGEELVAVVQQLNTRVFVPQVHEDIEAATAHLAAKGLPTTRLIPTRTGQLWHTDADGGVWRALTPIGDRTVDRLDDPALARSAAALIARFHAALADFQWDFRSVRAGAHDTDAHLDRMMTAVNTHRDHRLWWDTASLSETIGEGWRTWTGPTGLPKRVIHGDLKIGNVRFQGSEALALIDLDTLQHETFDVELGDAMRSWCNPAAEDAADTHFDLDLFAAAMEGYAAGVRAVDGVGGPTEDEWASIVPGVERICWELASRFARDALEEAYFGWNPAFGGRGEHNLLRARGQVALAKSVRAQRARAEQIVARARQ